MRISGIGRLIGELRQEAGISQNRLSKGLCSLQLLSKLEREERVPDVLLLESLLQRLGKSMEKFEIIISMEEYERIEHRDRIEDAIRLGKVDEGEEELKTYLAKYKKEGMFQTTYGCRMMGVIALERGQHFEAQKWFEKAITVDYMNMSKQQLKLSTFELENVVLFAQSLLKQEKIEESRSILEMLYDYARDFVSDVEETIKVQSKVVSLLGEIYNQLGLYEECIAICEPVFQLEREWFMMQAITLLMGNLITAYKAIGNEDKAKKILFWKEGLEDSFASQGLSCNIINGMYFNSKMYQYYLENELIRGERLRLGLTQEELCEGIYECVESVSRVETGKESPNRIKFQQIMERLGLERTHYNGYVATTDYKVLELDARIENLISRYRYQEAKEELEILEKRVDISIPQNYQLIQRRRNAIREKEGKLSFEDTKRVAEELLELTYAFKDANLLRVPFRNELYLYNQICMMMWKIDDKEKSLEWYRKMLRYYEFSKVDIRYHFRNVTLMIHHLADRLGKREYFSETDYWTRRGLMLCMKNAKSSIMEYFLMNLMCLSVDLYKNKDGERRMGRCAIACSELFNKPTFAEMIREYLSKT